jgi:hypothetical protein
VPGADAFHALETPSPEVSEGVRPGVVEPRLVVDPAREREWRVEGGDLRLVDGATTRVFTPSELGGGYWWVGPVLDEDGSVWLVTSDQVIHLYECADGWCHARGSF